MEDDIELKAEGTTEAAPAQEPAVETPAKQSEPAPLDPRILEAIRQSEERVAGKLGATIDRVTRPIKDETKARYDEISQRLNEIKAERLKGINDAVEAGLDPASAATMQRKLDIELFERERQEREQHARAAQQQPVQQPQGYDSVWEARKRDMLGALDLTGQEPEFLNAIAKWQTPSDMEGAASQFRRLAKEAKKAIGARVSGKPEARETKNPPIIEAGGGRPAATGSKADIAAAMEKIMQQPVGNDPAAIAARSKRLDELEMAWASASD